jgi:glycosyltransferase involved in cell wall biosynthesis
MRIAIISEVFLPKIDGVVNRTLNLIRQLPRYGDEVLIVCPHAPGCDHCSVPVVSVPSFSFPLYPEYRIGLPDQKLAETLKRFEPDVLHYLNPFAFGFRCNDVLHKARVQVPSVFSFHTLYGEFVKGYKALQPLSKLIWWLMREYHNRADVNLTVSGIMQADLQRRGFARVELWPPAVDSDLFHPARKSAAMRDRLSNGRPDRPLLLTVSRLAPEKNVGFLADVLKAFPDASLAIVGDGPARGDLERRFHGLDARFMGYLKGEQLAAAYASADAFVYASETETMGNVVLEAMACGCAVIAPHAGGIPNLVVHGATGFLYRPSDLNDAVQWTRTVLTDKTRRLHLGAAARQAVEERNWEQSIGRVRQAYLQAMEQPQPVPARSTWRDQLAQLTTKTLVSLFRSTADRRRDVPLLPAKAVPQEAFAAALSGSAGATWAADALRSNNRKFRTIGTS